jgi:hypothetical protein
MTVGLEKIKKALSTAGSNTESRKENAKRLLKAFLDSLPLKIVAKIEV